VHALTRSELRLRIWRAARLPDRASCIEQVRLWLPDLSRLSDDNLVERRRVAFPAGFDTELAVYVSRRAERELEARLMAIGADVGRCFAAVYSTRESGADAEANIADRLAFVAEKLLVHVAVLSVDDRVRGEPSR
jgi:hypothetical protein